MQTKIILIEKENLFTGQYSTLYTEDFSKWLVERYSGKHVPFSVYDGVPCKETDITFDYDKLSTCPEMVTILETPSGETAYMVFTIISAVLSVASMIYAYTHKPKIPNNISRSQESPNNQLGDRTNEARPLQRIPDIKGTVRSFPDVIMPSWTYYADDSKFTKWELGYYCVGRKQLSLSDIKEGETPIDLVNDASVEVYYPNKNPQIGSTPDVLIGEEIIEPLYIPYKNKELESLELSFGIRWEVEAAGTYVGILGGGLEYVDASTSTLIMVLRGGGEWLPSEWEAGEKIIVDISAIETFVSGPTYYYTGEYTIQSISYGPADTYNITIDMPVSSVFAPIPGIIMPGSWGSLLDAAWFYLTTTEMNQVYVTVEALGGLGRDTGTSSYKEVSIDYRIICELLDESNTPTGIEYEYNDTISGSVTQVIGKTTKIILPYPTRLRINVTRITNKLAQSGSFIQDITLTDITGLVDVDPTIDFGDITTIYTRTNLTPRSNQAISNRRLNCLATEMVYVHDGVSFAGSLSENSSAVQSFINDFVDPILGGRPIDELDVQGLLDLETEIQTHFGGTGVTQFDFTLDSLDITFQEYAQMLFAAIFSVPFREGSVVKAFFEKPVVVPSQIFTHRSKLPNTETYTRQTNFFAENDGVEFVYTDPVTDKKETLYYPSLGSSYSPKRIEQAGIRNIIQATYLAERAYNRMIYEKEFLEITVTPEARYVKPGDVISVTKGSKAYTMDGEILAVDITGYILTLSQDVTFEVGMDHSVSIKYSDGTIEIIPCTTGASSNEVVLDTLPTQSIVTNNNYSRRTEFQFCADDLSSKQWWVVRTIDASDIKSVKLSCTKYKDEYYAGDDTEFYAFSDGFSDGFS